MGHWNKKLRNSWREPTVHYWSLALKTAKFLEGTSNHLLGATGGENCAYVGKLAY